MRMLLQGLALLAHSQLVMALSAVCYVETAALVLTGRSASLPWLVAAGLGTLGIYLLDSVRSADREDGISQPVRAMIFHRVRGPAVLAGLLSLLIAGCCALIARPSFGAMVVLAILGLLGAAYLLPIVPSQQGLVTLKKYSRSKPFAISIAWLVGANVIGIESHAPGEALQWNMLVGFGLTTFPLLLLDSLWLDRRDMAADRAFRHPTLAAVLSSNWFFILRVVLFLLAFLGAPFTGLLLVCGFQIGAVLLLMVEPARLGLEASRVWLASLWRLTGLVGALILLG
jgi:hypothetical protein